MNLLVISCEFVVQLLQLFWKGRKKGGKGMGRERSDGEWSGGEGRGAYRGGEERRGDGSGGEEGKGGVMANLFNRLITN